MKYPLLARPWGYIVLWGILVFLWLGNFTPNVTSAIFSVSGLLVFSHVLYAGFFISRKAQAGNIVSVCLTGVIFFALSRFAASGGNPAKWYFWLLATFVAAIFFHTYFKKLTRSVCLKEFCNYKIFIEIYAIFLCLGGLVFIKLLHLPPLILALVTFFYIMLLNVNIIKKRDLYSLSYQPPEISANPLLSIVVIAFNEEQYIASLLSSIKNQDYKNIELIVVDDHSQDTTVAVAKTFEAFFPLKVVQKEKRGVSRSRNFGAEFAKGELILFLDADVVLPDRFISHALRFFKKRRLSIAGFDFIASTENKGDRLIVVFYRLWLKVVQYFNPRGIGFCLLVAKELHHKILFDEKVIMSEDFDYVKRASFYGKFRILTGLPVNVSWRRFQKENRAVLLLKYLFFEWYRQHIGEIHRQILPYKFGYNNT